MYRSIVALLVLPLLARADFTIWQGACTDIAGGSFDNYGISKYSQGACGGCGVSGEPGEGDIEAGNPCNCGETILFRTNGDSYNMYIKSTGVSIGSCGPAGPGQAFASCQGVSYTCLEYPSYRCVTTHCN